MTGASGPVTAVGTGSGSRVLRRRPDRSAACARAQRLEDDPDDDRTEDRDDQGREESGALVEAELARKPAADDRAEDADDDVRDPAPGRPAAHDGARQRPGEEADHDQDHEFGEGHRAQSGTSDSARKTSIAATNAAAC